MDADLRGFGFWASVTVLAHGSNFVVFRPLLVIETLSYCIWSAYICVHLRFMFLRSLRSFTSI